MNNSILDVAVIGGGHAGLSMSFLLKKLELSHLVFERNKIGNSWETQRWDSFKLNTSNKISGLPGIDNSLSDPDGFLSAKEFVSLLREYTKTFDLPVMENSHVLSVKKSSDSGLFSIIISQKGQINHYRSRKVVVASGSQNREIVPGIATNFSSEIVQLHAAKYRNANSLPNGAVLVVGSGQSGVQITDDLLDKGKKVFVSTSMVARVPRRYRGKDIMDWMILTGFMDQCTTDVTDPQAFKMKQPQVSGEGPRGKTLSLQFLAKKGAVILGKLENADGVLVKLQPNATNHVKFGDAFSQQIKSMIDDYIGKAKLDAPGAKIDEADLPDENTNCVSHNTTLNLIERNIKSVIWATGFDGDFSFLELPVFHDDGTLVHNNGIAEIQGLYFLGFPWLRKRKSGIIAGAKEDAEFMSQQIIETILVNQST